MADGDADACAHADEVTETYHVRMRLLMTPIFSINGNDAKRLARNPTAVGPWLP